MSIIVPAIIPTSLNDLKDKLSVLDGLCNDVQIDIVDGVFAGPQSWPYIEDATEPSRMLEKGKMLPGIGSFSCEIDLMSAHPEVDANAWIELGAVRLTIHSESTRFIPRFLKSIRSRYGNEKGFAPGLLSLGLSLGVESPVALIEPFLEYVDYVQFMGVRTIGRQGEPFDTRVLARIKAFRKSYPHIPIQVDGGVTLRNAPELLTAGVSRLVAGSAIWKTPDPAAAYRALALLTEEHGIYV